MSDFISDMRNAWRGMRKKPGFALLMVLTLAVGLAANATIFSTIDALILRPLSFPQMDRLMMAWETSPREESFERSNVAPANFLDWKAGSAATLGAFAALEWWDANVGGREVLERVQGYKVSSSFFELLGVRLAFGRGLLPAEEQEGRDRSVVLGDALWRRGYGADPRILSRSILVDGRWYAVVGVAPPGFNFPMGTELWAPLVLPAPGAALRDRHYLMAIGRLAPGSTLEQARARLEVVAARLAREYTRTNSSRGVMVTTLSRGMEDPGVRPVLAVWQAAAFFVLLVACVNVANLSLARGAERQRELAVRAALGASRGRIVRQLATEGMVLAACAAAFSVPLAWWATREIRINMPAEIARFVAGFATLGVSGRSLAFTGLLAVVAAGVFSAWPALRVSRPALSEILHDGGQRGPVGGGRQRGRNALVVAEVACALALMVGGGLAVRTAHRMLAGPIGYNPDRVLSLKLSLPESTYAEPESRRALVRLALERLGAIPGAARVAAANVLPGTGTNYSSTVAIAGQPVPDASEAPAVDARAVSSTYFSTLAIPIFAGRDLSDADSADALPVAVVSRSLAERFWPGRDPLGQRFRAGDEHEPMLTVVGVCGDVVHHWFGRRNAPTFYRPIAQWPPFDVVFAVRSEGEPEALALSARRALRAVAPSVPAYQVWSLRHGLYLSTLGLSYGAAIMSSFALLALVLAFSGVYGVMSYRVALRTSEIGVRVALGATPGAILRLILGQAARLAALGVALGVGLAVGLGRAMAAAFSGAVTLEVALFVTLPLALALAALVAAYLPARRALAVDPTQALKAQ
jgi:putative ABC transport system permease protein